MAVEDTAFGAVERLQRLVSMAGHPPTWSAVSLGFTFRSFSVIASSLPAYYLPAYCLPAYYHPAYYHPAYYLPAYYLQRIVSWQIIARKNSLPTSSLTANSLPTKCLSATSFGGFQADASDREQDQIQRIWSIRVLSEWFVRRGLQTWCGVWVSILVARSASWPWARFASGFPVLGAVLRRGFRHGVVSG